MFASITGCPTDNPNRHQSRSIHVECRHLLASGINELQSTGTAGGRPFLVPHPPICVKADLQQTWNSVTTSHDAITTDPTAPSQSPSEVGSRYVSHRSSQRSTNQSRVAARPSLRLVVGRQFNSVTTRAGLGLELAVRHGVLVPLLARPDHGRRRPSTAKGR